MKLYIITALIFSLLVSLPYAQSKSNIDPEKYIWKNRLILLFTPSDMDSIYLAVKDQMQSKNNEMVDRDIITFHILGMGKSFLGDSLLSHENIKSLRQNYQIRSGDFVLVLIGKDGGEKLRQINRFDLQTIFDRIDAMPMRRAEIQRRKKK